MQLSIERLSWRDRLLFIYFRACVQHAYLPYQHGSLPLYYLFIYSQIQYNKITITVIVSLKTNITYMLWNENLSLISKTTHVRYKIFNVPARKLWSYIFHVTRIPVKKTMNKFLIPAHYCHDTVIFSTLWSWYSYIPVKNSYFFTVLVISKY